MHISYMRSYNVELCGSNGTEHERFNYPSTTLQQHTEVRWDPWDETHRIPTAELVSSAIDSSAADPTNSHEMS